MQINNISEFVSHRPLMVLMNTALILSIILFTLVAITKICDIFGKPIDRFEGMTYLEESAGSPVWHFMFGLCIAYLSIGLFPLSILIGNLLEIDILFKSTPFGLIIYDKFLITPWDSKGFMRSMTIISYAYIWVGYGCVLFSDLRNNIYLCPNRRMVMRTHQLLENDPEYSERD